MAAYIHEYNLDGLIGPTHFFGGLGKGNIASEQHAGQASSPRAAALQGLEKMRILHDLGARQLVMPPHPRPAAHVMREKGYKGSVSEMIPGVISGEPALLPTIYSSSAMWTANAATVSTSADTTDGKMHITPANLISNAHRKIESAFTAQLLKQLLRAANIMHHPPLPDSPNMRDEGAANHMRISFESGASLNVFVYGAAEGGVQPSHYTPRQHIEASRYVASQHNLHPDHVLFLQQSPEAIDAGMFHNDVIATSHRHAIFYHEMAFADEAALLSKAEQFNELKLFRVSHAQLSLHHAVSSYLFNSQIVSDGNGKMLIVAPRQCQSSDAARAVINSWIEDANCPIQRVIYIDVDQSMANGGGPACLRLRLPMSEMEAAMVHPGVVFSTTLHARLAELIEASYPQQIVAADLHDPEFPDRIYPIYTKLADIFDLPSLYDGWI